MDMSLSEMHAGPLTTTVFTMVLMGAVLLAKRILNWFREFVRLSPSSTTVFNLMALDAICANKDIS